MHSNFVVGLDEIKQEAVVMEQENERLKSGHSGGYVKKKKMARGGGVKGVYFF